MSEEIKNVSQVKDADSLEKFIAYKKGKKIKISDVEFEDIVKNKSITFTFESATNLIIEAGLENSKQNYFFNFNFSDLRDRFCNNVTSGKKILTSQNLASFLMSYGDNIPGKDDDNEKSKDVGRRIRFILIYMFSQSLDRKNLGYLSEGENKAICDAIETSLKLDGDNKYAQHILKIFGSNSVKKDFFNKVWDHYNGPKDREFIGNVFRTYGDKFDTEGLEKLFGANGEKIDFDIDLINPESELSLYQICLKSEEKAISGDLAEKIISKIQTGKFKLTQEQQNTILFAFAEEKRNDIEAKLGEPFSLDNKKEGDKSFLETFKEKDKILSENRQETLEKDKEEHFE